jgi:hypothetical protein
MIKAIEFSTVLSDNTRIEIPVHLQTQLIANQAVRVIISTDKATEEMDRLWDENNWSEETMKEWSNEHLRTPYK